MAHCIKQILYLPLILVTLAVQAQITDTAQHVTDSPSTQVSTNKYGDLLQDDPVYNPKYAWWKPAIRVVASDVFNWALARYVYKFDWPATSISD